MTYFEVYHTKVIEDEEEFFSLSSDKPFPLISNRETVYINGKKYMVYRREQSRTATEITINYYVVTS
jgi:hypothetical protein